MKQILSLLCAAVLTFALAGCAAAPSSTLRLTDSGNDYWQYDFTLHEIENIQGVTIYLHVMDQNHNWSCNSGLVDYPPEIDDPFAGEISVQITQEDPSHEGMSLILSCRGGKATIAFDQVLQEILGNRQSFDDSSITSHLKETVEIVPDREIPLLLQVFSDGHSLNHPEIWDFRNEEVMAPYDAAIAITATFSTTPIEEL